ncbi:conserved hypothetical protein [Dinoroseobacter shibae DFL 12 = DSM 16493]|jgi:uncharacterized membrane protein|uniref:DUF2254 domain-containing protein n=1 Tax=Dinoroseobacter shibae (strain DSM 16493 / NCIMB 14021 / DFL 12) TaxID=398580 RepID=A8LNA6_DINSH|nr:DUF2254 domain-containing protein [Dinoroseobacter shibae]ABV93619.1 conserved hypothetical protein [Dinoroseobacter shibae DFL 12 = DSM 16493]URF45071.1 DUF2254 domain-containing protein [Dinoroseobacter shibae]URF49375.1 DUF2254 domain-containing protein [Dinoroseobacter shibae]
MTRLTWLKLVLLRYYRNMGLRVLLYALLSLVATLISPLVSPLLNGRVNMQIDFASVTPVLTILASSMLAVSTFSLNIMVSAHRGAADVATPRMHRILLEDTTTQSVLAAFIGAFVYSLGSIVLYRLGFYPEDAALVVMAITTVVVILVVISLLRWIEHLTTMGSLRDSLASAETRAREALKAQAENPRFGASPLSPDTVLPLSTTPLRAPVSGYLQLIDMAAIEDCLPDQAVLYLDVAPGAHLLEGEVIGQVSGQVDDDTLSGLGRALTFGDCRTHEQDAAFGLTVLSEIAEKALSPGINDGGTATEALLILKALLWEFGRTDPDPDAPKAPRVFAAFPGPARFIEAAFAPTARDGAGSIETALTLRQCLASLSRSDITEMSAAAQALAANALCYAEEAGMPPRDLDRLRAIAVGAPSAQAAAV